MICFLLFHSFTCRSEHLSESARARVVAGSTLRSLGGAADRVLASWVDTIWGRLRSRVSIRGYYASFRQRVDRVIWEVLEAELVAAADEVVRTDARVCVRFLCKESAERVFFPQRFVGNSRHGATPLLRVNKDGSRCCIYWRSNSPLTVTYRKSADQVVVEFNFVYYNTAGVPFHN